MVCLHSPPAIAAILEAIQVHSDQQINSFVVLCSMHAQT